MSTQDGDEARQTYTLVGVDDEDHPHNQHDDIIDHAAASGRTSNAGSVATDVRSRERQMLRWLLIAFGVLIVTVASFACGAWLAIDEFQTRVDAEVDAANRESHWLKNGGSGVSKDGNGVGNGKSVGVQSTPAGSDERMMIEHDNQKKLPSLVEPPPSASLSAPAKPVSPSINLDPPTPNGRRCVKMGCTHAMVRASCEERCSCKWNDDKQTCAAGSPAAFDTAAAPPPDASTSAATTSSSASSSSKSPFPSSKATKPVVHQGYNVHTRVTPVVLDNVTWWDGTYDSYPIPIPEGFGGPPLPEAVGRYAYVTMISIGVWGNRYVCQGLTHVAALRATRPDTRIDIVVIILEPRNSKLSLDGLPVRLGEETHKAFIALGVRFVIKHEYNLKDKMQIGYWAQAFSKLRVWSLTEYEKVVFLDADVMVLKNLDHLFEHPEFTAALSWNCGNALDTKVISGGFWVLQPSKKTSALIDLYLEGRDPCGWKWRTGDMTMSHVLFVDMEAAHSPDLNTRARSKSTWPRFDGDVVGIVGGSAGRRTGRCDGQTGLTWPHRFDDYSKPTSEGLERLPPIIEHELPTGRQSFHVSPRNRWHSLNESYDLLVGICHLSNFHSRYHPGEPKPAGPDGWKNLGWARWDAFAVHFSCGPKPSCKRHVPKDLDGKCQEEMLDLWWKTFTAHAPESLIRK